MERWKESDERDGERDQRDMEREMERVGESWRERGGLNYFRKRH
jgi:hypothetical protein